ncbi:hypothetical protein, partial [Sharpea azabuensis]|uniref:hypothetical protein n=1 Tax=Sharpea azabuensis TaxID=322505 RepID=UPI003D07237D
VYHVWNSCKSEKPSRKSETAKKRWEVVQMMILHRLFSIPVQIAFPQSQPLKIAKPQSRQLKIHPNSHPTVTPDQLSYFF